MIALKKKQKKGKADGDINFDNFEKKYNLKVS
jgi:hypothetical protein